MKTIEVKKAEEAAFKEWVADAGRTEYANLITDYESIYKLYRPL